MNVSDDTRQRCPEHGISDCSPLLNGCTWRPLSPYDLAREQYAAQLVDDVRDVLVATHDCAGNDIDASAVAVVALVYPTLQQVKDRDEPAALAEQARSVIAGYDGNAVRAVASLLRDLRRLYDDAQNVREQYGESCRKARDEADALQQELTYLHDVVRRVRQATRHVRTGRS